jgi:hypothetical protein
MKARGLAAFAADFAIHLLVACVVALLVFGVMRAVRPMDAIEHHFAAKITRAAFGS